MAARRDRRAAAPGRMGAAVGAAGAPAAAALAVRLGEQRRNRALDLRRQIGQLEQRLPLAHGARVVARLAAERPPAIRLKIRYCRSASLLNARSWGVLTASGSGSLVPRRVGSGACAAGAGAPPAPRATRRPAMSTPVTSVHHRGRQHVVVHHGRPVQLAVDQELALQDQSLPQIEAQTGRDALDGDRAEPLEPGVAPLVARVGGDRAQRRRRASARRRAGPRSRARGTPTRSGSRPAPVCLPPAPSSSSTCTYSPDSARPATVRRASKPNISIIASRSG